MLLVLHASYVNVALMQDGGWFDAVVTDYNAVNKTHW